MSNTKEQWNSQLGVIMAVAGSAVGLGNFLRFPGKAAQFGGGAFMLAYFVSLLIIGIPIAWAEWTLGRKAGEKGFHSAPGIFHALSRGKHAKYIGVIGALVPVCIYMYYVFIESWCLGYALNGFAGKMHFESPDQSRAFFERYTGAAADGGVWASGMGGCLPYLLGVIVLNFVLIYRGLTKGIEKFCTYAMPALVVLAIIVLLRVLTLGTPNPAHPERNVENGLGYLWNPVKQFLVIPWQTPTGSGEHREEWIGPADGQAQRAYAAQRVQSLLAEARGALQADDGKSPERSVGLRDGVAKYESIAARIADPAAPLTLVEVGMLDQLRKPDLWLEAAGQIFFSLSVGFGVILVYASYVRKNSDVVLSGLTATSANEFCEVALGGLISIPAAVAFLGIAGVAGMGTFGLGFQVLPLVFSEMPGGAFFGGTFFFLLFLAAVTSSLSMLQPGIALLEESLQVGRKTSVALLAFFTTVGTVFVAHFTGNGWKALDTIDFWVGTFLLFILATIHTVHFSWVIGVDRGLRWANEGAVFPIPKVFRPILLWVCPAFLLGIFSMWVLKNVFGVQFGGGESEVSGYVKDLFIEPNPVAWLSIGLVGLVFLTMILLVSRSKMLAKPVVWKEGEW